MMEGLAPFSCSAWEAFDLLHYQWAGRGKVSMLLVTIDHGRIDACVNFLAVCQC